VWIYLFRELVLRVPGRRIPLHNPTSAEKWILTIRRIP